jgi:hypothetical protein
VQVEQHFTLAAPVCGHLGSDGCPWTTDQDALITDFVALGFLPPGSDRRRIIPVMDAVLSPYLRGGGARAFNFQVAAQAGCLAGSCRTHRICFTMQE